MTARPFSLIAAVLVVAVAPFSGVASAEPEGDTSLANSPSLSLRTLGGDPTIALYGVEGVQTVSIPVQPGLLPTELDATALLPVNAVGGTVEVSQDDRVISRVPLPADRGRFVIPLVGARVVDNAVTVLVRSFLSLPDGYCVFDANNPLRLTDTEVRLSLIHI